MTNRVALILSTNINRRHLSTGQRAMIVAMLTSEAEKGGRGRKSPFPVGLQQRISEARFVLSVLPTIAEQVRLSENHEVSANFLHTHLEQLNGISALSHVAFTAKTAWQTSHG